MNAKLLTAPFWSLHYDFAPLNISAKDVALAAVAAVDRSTPAESTVSKQREPLFFILHRTFSPPGRRVPASFRENSQTQAHNARRKRGDTVEDPFADFDSLTPLMSRRESLRPGRSTSMVPQSRSPPPNSTTETGGVQRGSRTTIGTTEEARVKSPTSSTGSSPRASPTLDTKAPATGPEGAAGGTDGTGRSPLAQQQPTNASDLPANDTASTSTSEATPGTSDGTVTNPNSGTTIVIPPQSSSPVPLSDEPAIPSRRTGQRPPAMTVGARPSDLDRHLKDQSSSTSNYPPAPRSHLDEGTRTGVDDDGEGDIGSSVAVSSSSSLLPQPAGSRRMTESSHTGANDRRSTIGSGQAHREVELGAHLMASAPIGRPSAAVPAGYVKELQSRFTSSGDGTSGGGSGSGSGEDTQSSGSTLNPNSASNAPTRAGGGERKTRGEKRLSAMPAVSVAEMKKRFEQAGEQGTPTGAQALSSHYQPPPPSTDDTSNDNSTLSTPVAAATGDGSRTDTAGSSEHTVALESTTPSSVENEGDGKPNPTPTPAPAAPMMIQVTRESVYEREQAAKREQEQVGPQAASPPPPVVATGQAKETVTVENEGKDAQQGDIVANTTSTNANNSRSSSSSTHSTSTTVVANVGSTRNTQDDNQGQPAADSTGQQEGEGDGTAEEPPPKPAMPSHWL